MNPLVLVRQAKFHRLLPDCRKRIRLEASGITVKGDHLFVIFDNLPTVACIDPTLTPDGNHCWFGENRSPNGFEDIAYSEQLDSFFALIEARSTAGGSPRSEVVEYDMSFREQGRCILPFDHESENKGFEGLVHLRREGQDYLLVLCEGNHCKSGAEGRQVGNGRIQVFQRVSGDWIHVLCLQVPSTAKFIDFAAIDIHEGRIVILSQESAQIWIGTLSPSTWEFLDDGAVYRLPLHESGEIQYCNAEGIAWLGSTEVAVTSDRKKKGSSKLCGRHDQSIHIFTWPLD